MKPNTIATRLRLVGSVSLAVLAIALVIPVQRADAQSSWTEPMVIFSTTGYVAYPVLVPDPEGVVHLLFMFNKRKPFTDRSPGELLYARFADGRWSEPVDVLVAPDGGAVNQPSMAVDDRGFLHAVWQTATLSEVYYSRAHVQQAGSAQGWSRPVALSEPQSSSPAIATYGDGMVHVVYSGQSGRVTHRRSDDGGESWTPPVTLADFAPIDSAPDHTRLLADMQGYLHATWTQFPLPAAWPPIGTWYSRSLDGGQTWSDPVMVTGENYAQVQVAAAGEDMLHRVWNSMVTLRERWHQWSTDGGASWSPAQLISPDILRGGLTGFPAMAADSLGRLHLVTSVSGRSGTTEDVYHITWGGTWSDPTYISIGAIGGRSVEHPAVAIASGNHLHVVYEDDFERIWYTALALDAPAVPARQVPAPTPEPTPPPAGFSAEPAPAPTLAPRPTALETTAQVAGPDPLSPLVAAVVPSLLLLAAIALARAVRHTRR